MTTGQVVATAAGILALVTALLTVGAEWGDMRRSITEVRTTATQEHADLKAEIKYLQDDQDGFEDFIDQLRRSRGSWSPLDPDRFEPPPHTHEDGTRHSH